MSLDAISQTPSWSVVMPFYRNLSTIDGCIRSFRAQSFPPSEIVVCDDGSLSSADLHMLQTRWPAPAIIFSEKHGGQSSCTNHAIRRTSADFVFLTCADIFAPPNLLDFHRNAHASRSDRVAVVGPLPYASSVPMTPLMRYLSGPGVQFCFNDMADAENVNPMHCYAPNLSVSRAALLEVGLFDESFTYGMQDVDLGRRLGDIGVRFVLEPRAWAWHAQGTTLESYLRRQRRVGEAHVRWLEKYADASMAGAVAKILPIAQAYGKPFAALVTETSAAYAPYEGCYDLPGTTYARIFESFHLWFALALGIGVLEQSSRLQSLTTIYPDLRRAYNSDLRPTRVVP